MQYTGIAGLDRQDWRWVERESHRCLLIRQHRSIKLSERLMIVVHQLKRYVDKAWSIFFHDRNYMWPLYSGPAFFELKVTMMMTAVLPERSYIYWYACIKLMVAKHQICVGLYRVAHVCSSVYLMEFYRAKISQLQWYLTKSTNPKSIVILSLWDDLRVSVCTKKRQKQKVYAGGKLRSPNLVLRTANMGRLRWDNSYL